MMNDFCKQRGLFDTNIVTVNGLHDDKHYTSAFDLAKVTSYALKNNIFREIVSTKNAKIDDENAKDGFRYLKNKNKLLWKIDGANGVKTGYTKKAGRCFVGSAVRNDMEIVCVLLDCVPMFDDCAKLIEKGFEEFSMTKVFEKGQICDTKIYRKKETISLPVILTKDLYYPLKKGEFSKITARVFINKKISLPTSYENEIGKVEIKFQNGLIFSEKLFTINANEKKEKSLFKKIIKAF